MAGQWPGDDRETVSARFSKASVRVTLVAGTHREAVTIGLRSRTEQAEEAAAHGFLRAESAARRRALHRQPLLEHLACRLDTDLFDCARRRHSRRPTIMPDEAALAHRRAFGEHGNRQIAPKIVGDPGVKAFEALIAVLQSESRAELRLPAGALEEDDELAGDCQCDRPAEVRLDERQRQIDTGRDAG